MHDVGREVEHQERQHRNDLGGSRLRILRGLGFKTLNPKP